MRRGRAGLLIFVEGLVEGADLLAWVVGFAEGGGGIEEECLDGGGELIDCEPCLLAKGGGFIDGDTCLLAEGGEFIDGDTCLLAEGRGFIEGATCLDSPFIVGCLLGPGLRLADVAEVALTSPSMTVRCILPSKLSAVAVVFLVGAALSGFEAEGWSLLGPAMFSI